RWTHSAGKMSAPGFARFLRSSRAAPHLSSGGMERKSAAGSVGRKREEDDAFRKRRPLLLIPVCRRAMGVPAAADQRGKGFVSGFFHCRLGALVTRPCFIALAVTRR